MSRLFAVLAGASLLATPAFAAKKADAKKADAKPAAAAPAIAAGTITGTLTYEGAVPQAFPIKRMKDTSVCGDSGVDESLLVDAASHGVANAVVTVEGGKGKVPAHGPGTLDQKGCTYAPHVQALPVGATLNIVNSDSVLHNVHSYNGDQTVFNAATPLTGMTKPVTLKAPGTLMIRCDVHNWMNAWVVVTDTPFFAVTDAGGKFSISGLAPGEYTLKVWHEKLAPQEVKVTVPADAGVSENLKLAAK